MSSSLTPILGSHHLETFRTCPPPAGWLTGARGGFGRTDTTSCTERSIGDQENEQRFALRGHSLSARVLSRCVRDEGATSYIHTSSISTGPSGHQGHPHYGARDRESLGRS
jgi:hypothetical protein